MEPRLSLAWRGDGARAPAGSVAVVVDVLRGSTTLATAFALGARRAKVTSSVRSARVLGAQHNALLIGERRNARLPGFEYGNSPLELRPARLRSATLVFSSTNFPLALRAAAPAASVWVGALVNLSSVCRLALASAVLLRTDLCILLAGEPSQRHAVEDYYFGALAARKLRQFCRLDRAAAAAVAAMGRTSPGEAIRRSVHAQELVEDGFGEDVAFAFTLDRFEAAPVLDRGWLVAGWKQTRRRALARQGRAFPLGGARAPGGHS